VLLVLFEATATVFQTTWFIVSLFTELAVLLVLRTRARAWRSRPSRLLLLATVAVGLLALALPMLGPVAAVFGFEPLPGKLLAAASAIVVVYVVATEIAKTWFYRARTNDAPSPRP
jgi:Mg2+-importing ATPase